MKKIDLMLKLLFVVVFANVSYGQGVYPGGTTCATAVPIEIGSGYSTPPGSCGPDEWYSFTAPCEGRLTISQGSPNPTDRRIYSGVCGSLVEEDFGDWNDGIVTYDMADGETALFTVNDNWNCVGDFDIFYENPACPQPTSLVSAALAYDEALVAWFGGASSYTVKYGPSGFDPEVSGTTVVTASTSVTLTGLSDLTCYDVYVQASCPGGEVSCFYSGPTTFCTPAICPAPLFPNESSITNTDADITWSPGGTESAWDIEWGDEGFLLGTGTEISGTPFTTANLSGLTPADCYDWYVRAACEVDLGGGLETVYSLWVGPNEFCAQRNCLDPSGLTVISAPGTTATLGWTANNTPEEEEWNIQYGAPGFSLGSGVTITNVPSNPYTVTGLTGETDYCFYVQSVCGEGPDSLSNWVGPVCFTTGTSCERPGSLFAEGTSSTDASLEWVAGDTETEWTVSWGLDLADPMSGTMESASVFAALSLTGLEPGADYCYFVRAECGDPFGPSAWAGPFCWTQPELCTTPFNVNVINITNTAANVTFARPGAESWNIEWGAPCFTVGAGEEAGSVSESSDYPYYMTGLEANTPYEVYVQSVCGVDSISGWAGPFLFGTDITNDNPCTAEELVIDGPAVTRHNFDATILPGEAALAPPSADCYDTDGWCSGDGVNQTVWFSFIAPASGRAKVSTFNESECVTSSYTEIAIYNSGNCAVMDNFNLVAANTYAPDVMIPPYGSEITACGLTPGTKYYVMVNPIAFIESDITFGIQVTSIPDVAAGLGLNPTICAGSTYDLFDAIAGYSSEDGTWYNPTVAPGNELASLVGFPDAEGSFDLYYVLNSGCDADTVMTTVNTKEGVSAGGDGFYTACNAYDIVLSDHLTGVPTSGGLWENISDDDTTVALAGGLFAPLGMAPGIYTFLYTVTNEYCPTDSAYVTVTITECTDIEEGSNDNFVVYPNPVIDILTVKNISIEGNALIEVLDIEGRVVISNQVSDLYGNYTIDMSRIETGVYFVKVTSDESVQKVRVVKK